MIPKSDQDEHAMIQQDDTQDQGASGRRAALQKIVAGGAVSATPKIWVAPAVMAVSLPNHAQASEPPPPCGCATLTAANVSVSGAPVVSGSTVAVPYTISHPGGDAISAIATLAGGGGSLSGTTSGTLPISFLWVGPTNTAGKCDVTNDPIIQVSWTCICSGEVGTPVNANPAVCSTARELAADEIDSTQQVERSPASTSEDVVVEEQIVQEAVEEPVAEEVVEEPVAEEVVEEPVAEEVVEEPVVEEVVEEPVVEEEILLPPE